jgi:hypothetical protein
MTIAGDQLDAFAAQAVAIIFDLENPLRPLGTFVPRVGRKNSNALNMHRR